MFELCTFVSAVARKPLAVAFVSYEDRFYTATFLLTELVWMWTFLQEAALRTFLVEFAKTCRKEVTLLLAVVYPF